MNGRNCHGAPDQGKNCRALVDVPGAASNDHRTRTPSRRTALVLVLEYEQQSLAAGKRPEYEYECECKYECGNDLEGSKAIARVGVRVRRVYKALISGISRD